VFSHISDKTMTYPQLLKKSYFFRQLFEQVVVQIEDLKASAEISEAATAVQSDQFVVLDD
jgi:hypothetical protein